MIPSIGDASAALDIFNQGISVVKSINTKVTWDKVLSDTKNLVTSFESLEADNSEFREQLLAAFNDDTVKAIDSEIKDSGYTDIKHVIFSRLREVLTSFEIPEEDSLRICNSYWDIFLGELQKNNKDLYDKLIQFGYIRDIDIKVSQIVDGQGKILDSINDGITILNSIHSMLLSNTKSLLDVDRYLKQSTDIKTGLDFFDYGDSKFDEDFGKAFVDAVKGSKLDLHLFGSNAEEISYVVLSFIKKNFPEYAEKTLLVKSAEDWNKLEGQIKGYIVIPCIVKNTAISFITGNINILSHVNDKGSGITVRPRISSNTENALKNIGYSVDEAYQLAVKAHGIFPVIKRDLFKGNSDPAWFVDFRNDRTKHKVYLEALLLNQWKDSDASEVEELTGESYESFKVNFLESTHGDDPFIAKVAAFGGDYYQVLDPVTAWAYLGEYVSDQMWTDFGAKAVKILQFRSDVYNFPTEERSFRKAFLHEGCSELLRSGLLRTMILYRNRDKDTYQPEINGWISKLIGGLKSVEDWESFSEICMLVAEASPAVFIDHIYQELKAKDSLFLKMYTGDKGDIYIKPTYYTQFLFSIEKLLCYRESVRKAVQCLMLLNEREVKHTFTNSANDTLYKVFVPWHRDCSLEKDELINLAEYYVKNFAKGWNLIVQSIPSFSGATVSPISKPEFPTDELPNHTVSTEECSEIIKAYLELAFTYAGPDAERWDKLIDKSVIFEYGLENEALKELRAEILIMDDKNRISLKRSLRHEIYRNRYFSDALWAIGEERVLKLEQVFNSIEFADPEREFLYAFKGQIERLNPKPHTERTDWQTEAKENQEYRIEKLKEFKSKGYSLTKLLELCDNNNDFDVRHNIGNTAAAVYSDNKFDSSLFDELYSVEKGLSGRSAHIAYIHQILYSGEADAENEYLKAVDYLKSLLEKALLPEEEYVQVLHLYLIKGKDQQKIIEAQTDEIQKMYWNSLSIYTDNNEENISWVLENYIKYKYLPGILQTLNMHSDMFSGEDTLDIIINSINTCAERVGNDEYSRADMQMLRDEMPSVVENIQKKLKGKYEYYKDLSDLEFLFHNWLGNYNDFMSLKYRMGHDPEYAASFFIKITSEDRGEDEPIITREYSEEERQQISDWYVFFTNNFRFFPATDSYDVLDPDYLKKWVADFERFMDSANHRKACSKCLGRIFAHSPAGTDGYYPHDVVREIIEAKDDSVLNYSYIAEIDIMRGVHAVGDGTAELNLAEKYHKNAEAIRATSFVTAGIYDELAREYKLEAKRNRDRAVSGT